MKRPLAVLPGLFLLGILAGQMIEKSIVIPILAAIGAVGISRRSSMTVLRKQVYVMLLLLLFVLGFLWSLGQRTELREDRSLLPEAGTWVTLTGRVVEAGNGNYLTDTVAGRVLVYYSGNLPEEGIGKGDGISFSGYLQELSGETNPGGFDPEAYYRSEGALCCVNARKLWRNPGEESAVQRLLTRIRNAGKEAIYRILPAREAGVLSAMLLGEKSGVDTELKDLYRQSGIAHILAISGLHVSLLGGAIAWLLQRTGMSRRKTSVITILLILGYGTLTGFSPATVRAVLMIISVNLAGIFRRVSDLPTATMLSLSLLLVLQPYRAGSSGMLMSFLAVAGVVSQQVIYRDIFGRERFLRIPVRFRGRIKGLISSVLMSFMVWFFLLPVMLRDYYAVTPYSPLLNLLVVPLLTIAIAFGAAGLLLAVLFSSPLPGTIGAWPARLILQFYEWLCRGLQELPGHEIVTGHISDEEMYAMIALSGALILLLHRRLFERRRREKQWTFYWAALLMLLLGTGLYTAYGKLRNQMRECAVFFNVGQGDGGLLHTSDGNYIFDFGSSSREDTGKNILIPGLRYYGIDEVDLVVVSHTDVDHVSGITELLTESRARGIRIKAIAFAAGTEENDRKNTLCSLAEEEGVEIFYLSRGDRVEQGEVSLDVLYPKPGSTGEGNEYSLVIYAKAGDVHILYTGDIGADVERSLIPDLLDRPRVDILKVSHHGSRFSSADVFLETVGRGWGTAVISCGRNNMYGHPSPETLQRLEAAGFRVYRTDRDGAVVVDLP